MEPEQIAIALGAFFFAAFVKGLTGLGFSTTAIAPLAMTMGLKAALPLLLVPSLWSNVLVMRDAGRFWDALKRFWPLYLLAPLGVVGGLFLLDYLDPNLSAAALGVVLVVYGLFALKTPDLSLPQPWERPLAPFVGLVTGTVNGLTGSQVMPVLPYLMALGLETALFVQAINLSFTISSLVMVGGLSKLGLLTWSVALISALGVVPVYLGIKLGGRARRALSPETFRKLVLLVLIVMGITLAAKGTVL